MHPRAIYRHLNRMIRKNRNCPVVQEKFVQLLDAFVKDEKKFWDKV